MKIMSLTRQLFVNCFALNGKFDVNCFHFSDKAYVFKNIGEATNALTEVSKYTNDEFVIL